MAVGAGIAGRLIYRRLILQGRDLGTTEWLDSTGGWLGGPAARGRDYGRVTVTP